MKTPRFERSEVQFPLFECDLYIFAALRLAWSTPEVLDDLGALFFGEGIASEPRALFHYLFEIADTATVRADDRICGLRLTNTEERLRYANERHAALLARAAVNKEILEDHNRSLGSVGTAQDSEGRGESPSLASPERSD